MQRFRIISPNKRKFRMCGVEDDIAFSSVRDDTWHSKNRGSIFLNPSISESSGGDHIRGVPVLNHIDRNGFDRDVVWNDNANHTMVFWRLRKIGMNQNLKQSACIGFGSVDCAKANRIPTTPMKHGTGRIEDRMTRVSDSIRDHLYRQAEEQFVQ